MLSARPPLIAFPDARESRGGRKAGIGGTDPRFELAPRAQLIDEPAAVRLVGATPGSTVRLRAKAADSSGSPFQSWADFRVGQNGVVDPCADAAHRGTYRGRDPFGLWWSMSGDDAQPIASGLDPISVELDARIGDALIASARLQRLRVDPVVRVETWRLDGLRARVFTPAECPAPGVMVLGGSEGRSPWAEQTAALLASHGFVGMAVTYFGARGTPAQLLRIPVERFAPALERLQACDAVGRSPVGIVGASRGAELALLLGATFPSVRAVVGYAASAVTWPAARPGLAEPAWCIDGETLPFPVVDPTVLEDSLVRSPSRMSAVFRSALLDDDAVRRAEIAVERVRGPILLVSGTDDAMWPASKFATMVSARRAGSIHGHSDVYLDYVSAGHAVGSTPGLPAPRAIARHPVNGRRYVLGGTRAGNARAGADSWPRALAFLREALDREETT